MPIKLAHAARTALARRGFVVTRSTAVRRQRLIAAAGIDVVLDVGAAEGAYGRELRSTGYDGAIVSFEPLSAAYARLVAASGGDPRWQARNHALGDVTTTAEINVATNSDSSSFLPLAGAHLQAAPWVTYAGTETTEVHRLDDLADELLRPTSRALLKIDTQGFERQVLDGAAATLPRCAMVQLELSFTPLYEGGMLVDEALSRMYAAGYRMVALDQGFADPDGRLLQADAVFLRE